MRRRKGRDEKATDRNNDRFGRFSFDEYSDNREYYEKVKKGNSSIKFEFELMPKEQPIPHTVTSSNRTRLLGGYLFMLVLITVLIFRMGYWQIVRSDEMKQRALDMQKADMEIDPARGTIYDSKMNVLAETATEYELYGYTQSLYQSESLKDSERLDNVNKLAELTGKSTKTIEKLLKKNEDAVLLGDGLNSDDIEKAQKYWDSGIEIKTKVSRYYPNGAFAAQLLGGVDADNNGRAGLEYEYNSELAGVKGRTVTTTDIDGNNLANGSSKYYGAQDGYSLVTTIDSVVQHYVEDAIRKGAEKAGAESVTCIVTNPKTGAVLALARTPEYDPNDCYRPLDADELAAFNKMNDEEQSEYLNKMWRIDAVSDVYEPGSTFKLITAASALETGHADENSRYSCGGVINVNGIGLHCLGYHGTQNLKVAVGNSCNPAMARVALDMGAPTFYNCIDMFGFYDRTGIDLPAEGYPLIKDPDSMGDVDLATTGFGQGIAVTPIQVLCAINSFGNKGMLMQPRCVSEIVDSDGKTVKKFDPVEVRQTVSEEVAEKMCEIMEWDVSDGGCEQGYVAGFRVGGKTGTADIASSSGGYSGYSDCSFVAMAPMDNPQISMLVIVHKPTKIISGDYAAGPIVREIMEKTLMYYGVEREYTESEEAKAKKNQVTVPNVTGKDSKKAIAILADKKLKYKIMPESKNDKSFNVKDQYPKAGTKVDKNSVVYIYSE